MKTLLAEDLESSLFRQMLDLWIDEERNHEVWPDAAQAVFAGNTGDDEANYMRAVLDGADNFYVSPLMIRLATELAPEMPDENLLPYDLPSTSGWMWFGMPYQQLDIRRKVMSNDAILWHVNGGKVRLWHFTHRSNPNDWVNQWALLHWGEDQMTRLPILSVNHVFEMTFNETLPRGITWDTPLPFDANVEWTRQDNDDGSYTMTMHTDTPIEGLAKGEEPRYVRSPLAAFIVCLWRLCQQSIASRWEEDAARPARRRMLRANVPVRPISVIALRRFDQTEAHPDAHVEWQHHWVVRGHWRHQPYKEELPDGTKETVYRYIYISPYLKGDLDKPLLHREKVNALVR